MVTLSQLRTKAYAILREEEDSSAYPYTLIDDLLNTAQLKICSWLVINPLTKEELKKWQLPFLNSTQFYSSVSPAFVAIEPTVWATDLEVSDTTKFSNTWVLFIWWDIITYTGKTATSFTGCAWIWYAHKSWTDVSQVFSVPSNFMSAINVIRDNKIQLDYKPFDDIFEYLNSIKGNNYSRSDKTSAYESPYRIAPFYTIMDGQYLMIFNMSTAGNSIRLRYEKQPTEMTLPADTAIIDNDMYAKSTIPYLAIWETLFNRWEEWRWWELINFAMGQIKEMYQFYNKKTYEDPNWKQYKTAKGRLNI
jgi:hypothetical protein